MYNILLTDDEKIVIDSLTIILNKNFQDKVQLFSALSGPDALAITESRKIDIVFMDIHMPGMNGLETIRLMKQLNPSIIIIILSAYDQFQYAQEAINLGAYKYLTKPVNRNLILQTVKDAFVMVDSFRGKLNQSIEMHKKLNIVSSMVESDFIYSCIFNSSKNVDFSTYLKYFEIEDHFWFMVCLEVSQITQEKKYETYMKIRDIFTSKCRSLIGSFMANRIGIFVPMKLTVIEDRESIDEDGVRFYDSMVEKIARYANSQNKVTAADFFSNSPFHILMEQMSKKYLAPPVNGNPNPTGWYYERTKKKYNQEQMKMTKGEKDKFALKFPKKQIIKKEELAKYLYAVECKPDLVAKGSNWVIKDFGAAINEIYKKDKAQFNEYYFKKCVAATILYRTTDAYLEKLKKIPGAWYTVGGYKMNIVPYSISKIISCIPKGYSIDWMWIWNNQTVYPALMAEIERITQITNDFICDSHGVIVTEYCKKKETWEAYKNVPYTLSKEFLESLISVEYETEQASGAKSSQKTTNQVKDAMKIVEKGSRYWKDLLAAAAKVNLLNFKEISLMKVAIDIETTGKLPSPAQTKAIFQIETKINEAGIFVE